MNTTPAVLLAIITELAELAKNSLPKIQEGEKIKREWYENGIYYRETIYKGETIQAQFDFRQRKSRQMEAE